MSKKQNIKTIYIGLVLLVLGIIATIAVLAGRLVGMLQGEQECIPLVPDSAFLVENENNEAALQAATKQQNSSKLLTSYSPVTVSDNDKVWGTQTDVEIFKLSYKNGKQEVSVLSSDQDKVIAPGTENEYTFQIKNNSSAQIKYKMTCEVYSEPNGLFLPVEMSLRNDTGTYFWGSTDDLLKVEDLSMATEEATLAAQNYARYTLNWQWPFEWDNDEYDTYLGNRAVNEDLTVTVIIKTIAQWDLDKESGNDGSGLKPPKTGDTTNPGIYIAIGLVCLLVIVIIILGKKRPKEVLNDENKDQK